MSENQKRPRGRPRKDDVTRSDGSYANAFLAKNTTNDRASYNRHVNARRLDYTELENIYQGDGLAKKIIDLPNEEMTRCGFEIEEAEDIYADLEAINAMPLVTRAMKWSDLFGGSLIVMIVNDGGLLEEPLNENNVKEVESLRVYDRWQISRFRKYTDPADKRFGRTELYMISPTTGGNPYVVHESRCIVIDGIDVPDRVREQNDGWGNSKLQHVYDQLVKANDSHYWANGLLERAQQAVHSIPGLTNILRAPGGENLIRQRVDLVDMSRSVNNAVVIDGEESYDILSSSFASVSDIIDRLTLALCAVSDIPEQLLFGRQVGGINSNGQSSLESWYAKVAAWQRQRLLPILDRLTTLVLISKGKYTPDYTIEFKPLWMPSEKEEAETCERKAKTAEIYVNMGALDPSEVRNNIADEYHIDNVELMPEMPEDGEENDIPSA